MLTVGACQASSQEPVRKPFSAATSLQEEKIFTGQAKRVNLELRGNKLITDTKILKELRTKRIPTGLQN